MMENMNEYPSTSLIVCGTFFVSVVCSFFVHSAFFIRHARFGFLLLVCMTMSGLLTNSVFCFSRRAELNGFK